MAKFAVHERVEVDKGFYESCTGRITNVTVGFGEPSYSVDLDVGGKLIIEEHGLVRVGGRKTGTYRFEVR